MGIATVAMTKIFGAPMLAMDGPVSPTARDGSSRLQAYAGRELLITSPALPAYYNNDTSAPLVSRARRAIHRGRPSLQTPRGLGYPDKTPVPAKNFDSLSSAPPPSCRRPPATVQCVIDPAKLSQSPLKYFLSIPPAPYKLHVEFLWEFARHSLNWHDCACRFSMRTPFWICARIGSERPHWTCSREI